MQYFSISSITLLILSLSSFSNGRPDAFYICGDSVFIRFRMIPKSVPTAYNFAQGFISFLNAAAMESGSESYMVVASARRPLRLVLRCLTFPLILNLFTCLSGLSSTLLTPCSVLRFYLLRDVLPSRRARQNKIRQHCLT